MKIDPRLLNGEDVSDEEPRTPIHTNIPVDAVPFITKKPVSKPFELNIFDTPISKEPMYHGQPLTKEVDQEPLPATTPVAVDQEPLPSTTHVAVDMGTLPAITPTAVDQEPFQSIPPTDEMIKQLSKSPLYNLTSPLEIPEVPKESLTIEPKEMSLQATEDASVREHSSDNYAIDDEESAYSSSNDSSVDSIQVEYSNEDFERILTLFQDMYSIVKAEDIQSVLVDILASLHGNQEEYERYTLRVKQLYGTAASGDFENVSMVASDMSMERLYNAFAALSDAVQEIERVRTETVLEPRRTFASFRDNMDLEVREAKSYKTCWRALGISTLMSISFLLGTLATMEFSEINH